MASITVKFLEELGIEKAVAEQIFARRGEEITKANAEKAELEAKIAELETAKNNLDEEIKKLNEQNLSAEEWKTKFEELQNENIEKQKKENEEKAKQVAEKNNRCLFEKALKELGKNADEWTNSFTSEGYYNKFVSAISSPENEGKSHKEILHELTKDDSTAFKTHEYIHLSGGKIARPQETGKYKTREEILKIKDAKTRQLEMITHPELFPEIEM